MLYELLKSNEPEKRQIGQLPTGLEYENLMTALNLALEAQVSILEPYRTLFNYLDISRDQQRGLDLGQIVLSQLERYSHEKLAGWVGAEFVGVIDGIAKRQFVMMQYKEAGEAYQKALAIHHDLKIFDEKTSKMLSAGIYHQLGAVAQAQRQWQQAEQYYQQALQIYIEYNDYGQAGTYHQLGTLAQDQQQWKKAEQYYQHALQIKIEYNDRYSQASTYHQLGIVADEQRQWQQVEQYYQQALQIYIAYNDRYNQASIYGQLGLLAQDQQQWQQTSEYLLQALQIFIFHKDDLNAHKTLRNLARLWKASDDINTRTSIANGLGMSIDETENLLLQALEEPKEEQTPAKEKKE